MAKDGLWDYPWWANYMQKDKERYGQRHWEPPEWLLTWANEVDTLTICRDEKITAHTQSVPPGRARQRAVAKNLVTHHSHV
eukprot:5069431-Amphidinium_carterae.2